MEFYYYIIIAVVALVVLGFVFYFISRKFKSKKSDHELLLESRQSVNDNAQYVDVLVVLAKGKTEILNSLNDLKEKLQYLSPSSNEKVAELDSKIKATLGDIKIELSKNKNPDESGKTERLIQDILVHIAERNVYTAR